MGIFKVLTLKGDHEQYHENYLQYRITKKQKQMKKKGEAEAESDMENETQNEKELKKHKSILKKRENRNSGNMKNIATFITNTQTADTENIK